MAKQHDKQDKDPVADRDKAQGTHEPLDEAMTGEPQGITNRPLDEELEEQGELPPRGTAKEEA
jgi:hypothetical protein